MEAACISCPRHSEHARQLVHPIILGGGEGGGKRTQVNPQRGWGWGVGGRDLACRSNCTEGCFPECPAQRHHSAAGPLVGLERKVGAPCGSQRREDTLHQPKAPRLSQGRDTILRVLQVGGHQQQACT